ncbi:MAG: hypothetical protein [Bacteriophage sp.]|nr:MAG: hypothetical protein [Bacteriophage sp.]
MKIEPKNLDERADLIASLIKDDDQMVTFNNTDIADIEDWLPTLIPGIDAGLTGGVPLSGRATEIFGDPSVGKSTLVMNLIHIAQLFNITVIYFDVENTTSNDRLEELGIDPRTVITRKPKRLKDGTYEPLSIEEIMQTMINYAAKINQAYPNAMTMFVWDTIADTGSIDDLKKTLSETNKVGAQAKALTDGLRRLTVNLAENNACLIAINQVRDDIGSMRPAMYKSKGTAGGNAWQHGMSLRLQMKRGVKIVNNKSDNIEIGHEVLIKFLKSKIASNAAQMAKGYFLQDTGFDLEYNVFEEARELGWVKTGRSSRYFDEDGNEVLAKQTKDFVPYLKSDEGQSLFLDMWERLIKYYFPYCYPPLFNLRAKMTDDMFPRISKLRDYYIKIQEGLPELSRHPLYRKYKKKIGISKPTKASTKKTQKNKEA